MEMTQNTQNTFMPKFTYSSTKFAKSANLSKKFLDAPSYEELNYGFNIKSTMNNIGKKDKFSKIKIKSEEISTEDTYSESYFEEPLFGFEVKLFNEKIVKNKNSGKNTTDLTNMYAMSKNLILPREDELPQPSFLMCEKDATEILSNEKCVKVSKKGKKELKNELHKILF